MRLRRYVLWAWLAVLVAPGVSSAFAMELVATIGLPDVKGRIDHLAADPKTHRLFVAASGNNTVEALDTQGGRRQTITGLGEPQGVLYVAGLDRLFVANGGSNRVDLVDVTSLSVVKRIEGMDDADNVRYDVKAQKVWVGYGKGSLRVLDPASGESGGDIKLPGHPESFELEREGARGFVNVPSARSVMVVDRSKLDVVDRWETPEVSSNFPMALDERGGRLFIGARSPPTLLVYDSTSGRVVARLPIGQDVDDLFFDSERKRIYVICGEGKVEVSQKEPADRYAIVESITTAPRARTGLYVPEEGRLYVAAPASGASTAKILVYRVH